MKSPVAPPAGVRPWLPAVALAVGLGGAPLLLALAPWPTWAALGAVLAVVLVALPAASAELASARRDAELSRHVLAPGSASSATGAALFATCLAALAAVQASWAAAVLARLVFGGPAATAPEGLEALLGSRQGFLGLAGWQGSGLLLATGLGVIGLAGVGLVGRGLGRWLAALLVCWLAGTLACGWRLWSAVTPDAAALLDTARLLPTPDRAAGTWGLAALLAGLLAAGAATGAVQATVTRVPPAAPPGGRGRVLLPLAATLLGLVALAPLTAAPAAAPLLAPAPFGRQAALLLAVPPAMLGGVGWQVAWFASLLAAGLLGVLVAAQPALRVLQAGFGLGARGAGAIFAVLLALVVAPCLLLPGAREGLMPVAALGVLLLPARLLVADWPQAARTRLARGVALALVAGSAALAVAAASELRGAAWPDEALARNGLLGLGLGLALLLFWVPLAVLAGVRARRLRRPEPASPAAPRTPG